MDLDFNSGLLCSISEGSILVVNTSVNPCSLVKFRLIDAREVKLERYNETINTKLTFIHGLTQFSHKGKKLVIVTNNDENTIEAIDYVKNEIVWKIVGEMVDGKIICPYRVCHDNVGHLYVADSYNNSVLVVSCDGKIKQKLLDLPNATRSIGFDNGDSLYIVVGQ